MQNSSHFLSSGKFFALCLANNTRNKSELSENSHTEMFVINSSLAYVFHFSRSKHPKNPDCATKAFDLN